ncbi:MAG TPA: SDR family oxidoreductase [Sphingomonadaceae bacterium]|nr:SDR family oxidoreductase [Sphingomonadaceae bacterium]
MSVDELFDISGKVALVTGGTSGIGLMIARGFVRRGVRTYIASRDQARSDATAAELSDLGECHGLCADLAEEDGPARLAAAFAEREQRLDILVNNAGANARGKIEDLPMEAWDMVMAVNLRSIFYLTQQLLPQLHAAASAESPARIINLGSIGGQHIPNWEAHPYGASKAAVHHLTRSLAKRFGPEHIRVNAIAPGPFQSRLTDTTSDAVKKSVATYIPAGRPGTPEDMEGLAVFLASRAGAYVNGSTIALDGGYLAAL